MQIGTYQAVSAGKVAVHLPAPVPELLAMAAASTAGSSAPLCDQPLATASAELANRDPLAVLEAQYAAQELGLLIEAALMAQSALLRRVLGATTEGGDITVVVTGEQLLELSGALNALYIEQRHADTGDVVTVGGEQSLLGDGDLNALLGIDDDETQTDDAMEISMMAMILTQLATEFALVFHEASAPHRP
jgi:hypothetical protein